MEWNSDQPSAFEPAIAPPKMGKGRADASERTVYNSVAFIFAIGAFLMAVPAAVLHGERAIAGHLWVLFAVAAGIFSALGFYCLAVAWRAKEK